MSSVSTNNGFNQNQGSSQGTSTGASQGASQGTSQGTSNSSGQSTNSSASQGQSYIPDYEPQLGFLEQFGNTAGGLASQQYDWASNQFDNNTNLTDSNVNNYLQNHDLASQGAQRDYANYNDIFNPAASSLTNDWQSYTSPERVNSEMGRSEANVAQNFEGQRGNLERNLRGYGVNPSDPRYAGAMAANRTAQAATEAGAGTQARLNTEATGRQLRQDALNEAHLLPGQGATEQNVSMQGLTGAENAAMTNTSMGALTMGTTPQYVNAGISNVKFQPLGNASSSMGNGQSTNSAQSQNTSQNTSQNASQNASQNGSQNTGFGQTSGNSASVAAPSGGGGGGSRSPGSTGQTGGQQGPGPSQGGSARPANNGTSTSGGASNTRVPSGVNGPNGTDFSGAGGPSTYHGPGMDNMNNGITNLTDPQQQSAQDWWNNQNNSNPGGEPNPAFSGNTYGIPYSPELGISMQEWRQMDSGPSPSSEPAPTGGGQDTTASYDDGSGGYAQGGAIHDPQGGGFVPPQMSPSGGQQTDDVTATIDNTGGQAHINAGEFVMPKDVVEWMGHKFFQDLIMKSRKARMANPGPAHPTQGPGGPQAAAGGDLMDMSGGFDASAGTGTALAPPRMINDLGMGGPSPAQASAAPPSLPAPNEGEAGAQQPYQAPALPPPTPQDPATQGDTPAPRPGHETMPGPSAASNTDPGPATSEPSVLDANRPRGAIPDGTDMPAPRPVNDQGMTGPGPAGSRPQHIARPGSGQQGIHEPGELQAPQQRAPVPTMRAYQAGNRDQNFRPQPQQQAPQYFQRNPTSRAMPSMPAWQDVHRPAIPERPIAPVFQPQQQQQQQQPQNGGGGGNGAVAHTDTSAARNAILASAQQRQAQMAAANAAQTQAQQANMTRMATQGNTPAAPAPAAPQQTYAQQQGGQLSSNVMAQGGSPELAAAVNAARSNAQSIGWGPGPAAAGNRNMPVARPAPTGGVTMAGQQVTPGQLFQVGQGAFGGV